MVAYENDIDNLREVPLRELRMEFMCKAVDINQRFLKAGQRLAQRQMLAKSPTLTGFDIGPLACPAWSSDGSYTEKELRKTTIL